MKQLYLPPSPVISEGLASWKLVTFSMRISTQEIDHNLITPNFERIRLLTDVRSIVIIGSSCSGKSTAVDIIRNGIKKEPGFAERFIVPQRIITRPIRANDNLIENLFVKDKEELLELTQGGIYWRRNLGKKKRRIEYYGFGPVPKDKIPIYSCNDAFLEESSNLTGIEPDFFDHALIIRIYAYNHVRTKRFIVRSPDIAAKKDEAAARLKPKEEDYIDMEHFSMRTRSSKKEIGIMKCFILCLLGDVYNKTS